jgi:hypothetical protein
VSSQPAHTIASRIRPEFLLAGFLVFCLHYYAYVYLFAFDEGVSAAPGVLKAVKDIVFIGALIALGFATSRDQAKPWQAYVFWPFLLILAVTTALHVPQTGWYDQLRENIKNLALFVPIYWMAFSLTSQTRKQTTKHFFGILIFAAITQSLFSFLFWFAGKKLWLDEVFVGFIGNPNSFALMLNLALAVLLMFLHRSSGWKLTSLVLIAVGLIAATIMRTTSGSQFAIFVFLLAYSFILNVESWKKYAAVALVVTAVIGVDKTALDSTLFIFQNLASTIAGTNDPSNEGLTSANPIPSNHLPNSSPPVTSLSVSLREQNIRQAFSVLTESPEAALLGSFMNTRFVPMDGQFWVMLYNNGIATILAFAIAAAFAFTSSGWYVWRHRNDKVSIVLHLMIAAFGITCLASRIIMYFPFNFMFFMICGLAIAKATEARR